MISYETLGSGPVDMVFAHGIFGRGVNWRGIAKAVCGVRGGSAALVDLRNHGQSQSLGGPSTLARTAEDVAELWQTLSPLPRVLVGHSFGGKVSILAAAKIRPQTLWLLDVSPASQPGAMTSEIAALRVLRFARTVVGERYEKRSEFVAAMRGAGFEPGVAHWFAMNLREENDGFVLGLDVDGITEQLRTYFEADCFLELPNTEVHLVCGGDSDVVSEDDKARAASLGWRVHTIAGAGHWLHVDKPDQVIALLGGTA